MTLSVIRAKDIQRCTGGFPAIVRGLLEQIRADTQDGMVISLDSGPELLFIDRVLVLADHEGMRALSGWKGSSGYRPCFKCANVVSLDGARPASFVDIANSDITRLQPLSHTNLCEIRQELDSLSSTTTKLQEAEKLLGWKFQELSKSFLASPALSGWAELEDCAVDAMHAYWSNGVVAQELGLWYTALLDNSDVNLGHVQTYVKAGWTACPAAGTCMSNVWSYFSENLWRKNQDFRGGCEGLPFRLTLLCAVWRRNPPRQRLVYGRCLGFAHGLEPCVHVHLAIQSRCVSQHQLTWAASRPHAEIRSCTRAAAPSQDALRPSSSRAMHQMAAPRRLFHLRKETQSVQACGKQCAKNHAIQQVLSA